MKRLLISGAVILVLAALATGFLLPKGAALGALITNVFPDNGNVGIGTTSPGTSKLKVVGYTSFQGGRHWFTDVENRGRVRLGAAWGIPGLYSEDGQDLVLGVAKYRNVKIGSYGNFMTVQGNGNVGIGTRIPQSALQVNGYIQIGTLQYGGAGSMPSPSDCDVTYPQAKYSETGRMMFNPASGVLYICGFSGWIAK